MYSDKLTNIGKILTSNRRTIPREAMENIVPVETKRQHPYVKVRRCYSPIPLVREVHTGWGPKYDVKHECVRQVGLLSTAGVEF